MPPSFTAFGFSGYDGRGVASWARERESGGGAGLLEDREVARRREARERGFAAGGVGLG